MAAREYVGAGGMRVHLDEPLSDEMAKQVAKGQLHPVIEPAPAEEDAEQPAPDPVEAERPAKNAPVADWRAYAVALGMEADDAKDATKAECQDYVQVVEDARNTGTGGGE